MAFWRAGGGVVAGVDEAGRGPLAGPVVAAAVVFPPHCKFIRGLRDSKLLPPAKRSRLALVVRARALARSEEHTSELQSQSNLVCRLLLEKKKTHYHRHTRLNRLTTRTH